ncbi:hypothetical protein [Microbulbifer spongiae]|uniref:DUF3040 domain-containing protein n=1 Tax=Microbulbifer spongiae TaxID=2944933 RepID=A0ABY9E879_9GAMM|nr:hypothetical protein [Microbulbifer sp. MI-G]WKD48352.1 hypothetical protein M8T91_10435 [Microbulbifer sp. MI-G]
MDSFSHTKKRWLDQHQAALIADLKKDNLVRVILTLLAGIAAVLCGLLLSPALSADVLLVGLGMLLVGLSIEKLVSRKLRRLIRDRE